MRRRTNVNCGSIKIAANPWRGSTAFVWRSSTRRIVKTPGVSAGGFKDGSPEGEKPTLSLRKSAGVDQYAYMRDAGHFSCALDLGDARGSLILEKLNKLRVDTESQIAALESKHFRLLSVRDDGQTQSDCSSEHAAILRQYLGELLAIIELVSHEMRKPQQEASTLT